MRIGILTFFNGFNFGANLQAVSTYLYLKKHGHTPIFINYKSKENYNRWLNLHQNNQFQEHLRFVNSIIKNQTPFCHNSEEIMDVINSEKIDAVIIGSDAVWELNPAFNDDMHLFGHKIKANKIFTIESANESNVVMYALESNVSSSLNSGILPIFFLILSFISSAAALVNVKINSSFTCIPFCILLITLSDNTAVLPLPAPAETIIFLPSDTIASSCSLVHLGIIIHLTKYIFYLF